jgi:hypothetical protein
MKPSMLILLVLASCTYGATEAEKAAPPVEEPKPGIREKIVPGTTYGNASLQAKTVDAIKAAFAAKNEHVECSSTQIKVSDTWAPNEPRPSEFSSTFLRWKELWTLDVCGDSIDFEVIYLLHRTGIITMSVSQQSDRQPFALD